MASRNQSPAPLEIRQVANGFIVIEPGRAFRQGSDMIVEESQVFQTFAALVSYLADYFPWRAGTIPDDLDGCRPLYGRPGPVIEY